MGFYEGLGFMTLGFGSYRHPTTWQLGVCPTLEHLLLKPTCVTLPGPFPGRPDHQLSNKHSRVKSSLTHASCDPSEAPCVTIAAVSH